MPDADHFDPGHWEAADGATPGLPRGGRPRQRRKEKFLRGPVPWPWLRRAMSLPGKALAVGLMLWLQAGITGRTTVQFCLGRAAAEGVPVTTARRAVVSLERAGLIAVARRPGRGLEVTLLHVS